MHFEDELTIAAPPEDVWEVISDPEILVSCVPGAEEVRKTGDREYTGTIRQTIAGYDIEIDGVLEQTELDPYTTMRANVRGEDESAGSWTSVDGTAELVLTEVEEGTRLAYDVDIDVSGRLASIGARILKYKLKRDVNTFFENVREKVT